jgi:hypothetical protein
VSLKLFALLIVTCISRNFIAVEKSEQVGAIVSRVEGEFEVTPKLIEVADLPGTLSEEFSLKKD